METWFLRLVLILAYEFLAFGIITPYIILARGLEPFLLWFIINTIPWAAIIYYREELGIKRAQKEMSGFIGTNRATQALNELVDMLPKHHDNGDDHREKADRSKSK